MTNSDHLRAVCGDLFRVDVAAQDVPAAEAALQKAGAVIVSKFRQAGSGLFTVFGITQQRASELQSGLSAVPMLFSDRSIPPQRQTADRAMMSGR
jgi:hypothetical protein